MVNFSAFPKQVGKTSKQTAQDIAKRIAQEQLEIAQSARKQVLPTPEISSSQLNQAPMPEPQAPPPPDNSEVEKRLQMQATQRLMELESEIKRIGQQKQETYQQKFVNNTPKEQPVDVAPVINTKRPRGMMGTIKKKLSDMSGRAEKQKNAGG